MRTKITRILTSLIAAPLLLTSVTASPAQADVPIINIADGSTLIGDITFTITIPQLDADSGNVHLEMVDVWGNASTGFSADLPIRNAGTHTYTINPFATQTTLRTQFETPDVYNIYGSSSNSLGPGSGQIEVDWYQGDSTYASSRQIVNSITFKYACGAGTYSTDGGAPVNDICTLAPLGMYVPAPKSTSATICPAGSVAVEPGQSACDPAPAGSFSAAGTGSVAASLCEEGTYQPDSGQATCLAAREGHKAPGFGNTHDTACLEGTYQSSAGQTSCIAASLGHYVDTSGATSELACAKGSYASQTGQWRCTLAAPNYYVDTEGASTTKACPAKYTSAAGSTSKSACKAPTVAMKFCVIKKNSKASVNCLAASASTKIPAKAKTTISINKGDKSRCAIVKGALVGKAKGTCNVTLTVKPKSGATHSYSARVKVT